MQHVLIFLPNLRLTKYRTTLYGVIVHCETGIAVYILGNSCDHHCEYLSHYETIGEITSSQNTSSKKHKSHFWVSIQLSNNLNIEKITLNSDKEVSRTTVILYNKDSIKRSQLLGINYCNVQPERTDYIFRLIHNVQNEPKICRTRNTSRIGKTFLCFIMQKIFHFQQWLLNCIKGKWMECLFKDSSFGSNFFNILETFTNMLQQISENGCLDLQYTNYLMARICDALLGEIIIYYVMSYTTSDELFSVLIQFQEFIVTYLKNTVEWLMGSPAGFKLYCPLNNILGLFYQFHISLWWTFLKLSNPFLKLIFNFFLFLGNFGFSFQVSILADLLAVVSVHMYCIYVYAARLYFFQMKGLKILSRLFIGRKRDPLPGNIHSSPYTTEQLLFGTVSFTVILFLLPTTLIYYVVFTGIRIILIFIGGLLTRLKYFMNVFPVYLTFLWFYNPKILTCKMRLNMKADFFPDGTLVTQIKPICDTWWKTVDLCVPKTIRKPDKIEWRKLTTDVLIGNLIYPV